jgi:hypothetical protein
MSSKNIIPQFQSLQTIETGINKNFFLVTTVVTVIAMAMMTIAFFTRGEFPAEKMSMFYVGVVIVYSFHKELLRWLGETGVERQGEYFVYSWIGLTTFFYTINFITKDYFSYSPTGDPVPTLRETASLTVEILVIFVLTRGLKILKVIWEHRNL